VCALCALSILEFFHIITSVNNLTLTFPERDDDSDYNTADTNVILIRVFMCVCLQGGGLTMFIDIYIFFTSDIGDDTSTRFQRSANSPGKTTTGRTRAKQQQLLFLLDDKICIMRRDDLIPRYSRSQRAIPITITAIVTSYTI